MKRRTFISRALLTMAGLLFFKDNSEAKAAPDVAKFSEVNLATWSKDTLNICWIGHSTILINFYGKYILTDPVMYRSIGISFLGTTLGPSRSTAPAIAIEDLPKIDLVLLSHGHMDHTDYPTLKYLTEKFAKQIDCITAYNTADISDDLAWKSIKELDWNEETVWEGIRVRAFKTQHFGWRFPWEKDRSKGFFKDGRSFNAYLLDCKGKKIVFGGDTALTDSYFNEKLDIDVAIMPIGAYNPWKTKHCSPEEAVKMAGDMKAKVFIPIHCETFKLGMEPMDEPLIRLKNTLNNSKMSLGISSIGDIYTLA